MRTRAPVGVIVVAALAVSLVAQRQGRSLSGATGGPASIRVVALDSNGKPLGAPEVSLFENENHKSLAGSFHSGVADRIPFGQYRMKAHVPGFYSEVRYVRVYQERTIILLGLEPGYEASPNPPILHGRVISQSAPLSKNSFVKLAGVFSSLSMESAVRADGSFEFAGVPWGRYVLLVLSGEDVVGTRFVSLPQDGPDIQVEAGRDHAVAPAAQAQVLIHELPHIILDGERGKGDNRDK